MIGGTVMVVWEGLGWLYPGICELVWGTTVEVIWLFACDVGGIVFTTLWLGDEEVDCPFIERGLMTVWIFDSWFGLFKGEMNKGWPEAVRLSL